MRIHITLFYALLIAITGQLHALKLMSPESICQQRGIDPNSPAWQLCIQEATAENERITREFYEKIPQQTEPISEEIENVAPQTRESAADTRLLPPFVRKNFEKRLNGRPSVAR